MTCSSLDFTTITDPRTCAFIDVRSPAEFEAGHIPEAVNVPLFDNDERAEIGTIYKKIGRDEAISRGLELATPKIDMLLHAIRQAAARSQQVIIYCWRGGMRSGEMCRLAQENGIAASRIEGGYKAYRRAIRAFIEQPRRIIMLGGKTGSGKTALLLGLKREGVQVIDLEGLAHHKGSVFGHINEPPQPTTEQFENNLYEELRQMNPQLPLLLENESHIIGSVHLPQALLQQMRAAPLIVAQVPTPARLERLIHDYTHDNQQELITACQRLEKRLGSQKVSTIITFLRNNDFHQAGRILLDYYDAFYNRGLEKRQNQDIHFLPLTGNDLAADVAVLKKEIARISPPAIGPASH